MTSVRQLAYLGLEVSDLPKWERFAVDLLGLAPAARGGDGSLALRMDEREQRVVLHPGPADDLAYLGFECANDAELEALGARLVAAGFAVGEGKPEKAAARRVTRLLELSRSDRHSRRALRAARRSRRSRSSRAAWCRAS